jgi:hypothetical protein
MGRGAGGLGEEEIRRAIDRVDETTSVLCVAVKAQEAASVCSARSLRLYLWSLEARRRAKSVGLEHARRRREARGTWRSAFLVAAGAEEADYVGRPINHLTTVVV